MVPVELMEREDKGVLRAWMALTTVRERVEKMWTSLFWGVGRRGVLVSRRKRWMRKERRMGRQDKNCPQTGIKHKQL